MVIPYSVELPSEEELTVQELPVGTPYMRAAALHMGMACQAQNNEFMLCRIETNDSRKCVEDGKAVTACAIDFFQRVKGSCAAEFTRYSTCLEKSSREMRYYKCRKTQAVFDECMKDKLGLERPHYGYLALTKVHETSRPKPEERKPEYMDDPRGKKLDQLPEDFPKQKKKYGNFWSATLG